MAPNIIHSKSWEIAGLSPTPQSAFINRRKLVAGMGAAAAIGAIGGMATAPAYGAQDPSAGYYPAKRNQTFKLDRELTPEDINATYNNFFEFGSHKKISQEAQALRIRPWTLTIDGLVEKPMEIAIDDLLAKIPLEERLYRHRCVERWSMTIPWSGFPLRALLNVAKPLSGAKFVRFETFMDPTMASGQRQSWYPWPYIEGLTIEEAANDLAFMATGAYGKPLVKQHGSPLRLALPWKYGFKSIKSIVKISFTETAPKSFWQTILPEEYGFYANINPKVDHRRWSQANEQILHSGEIVPTLLFNGYGEQVAGLYADMKDKKIWY